MSPRFWVPSLTAGLIEFSESEAHHARSVLRLKPGEEVELFDGQGRMSPAILETVDKRRVAALASEFRETRPRTPGVVLATAVPKGERFDWLIEKATELGVERLVPLHTARSSVEPRETKLDRLRQTVIAACKQCRRDDVMVVAPTMTWEEFAVGLSADTPLVVAHPDGTPVVSTVPDLIATARHHHTAIALAIGPEGGWTDEELAVSPSATIHRVSLGPHILRTETAAITLAALAMLARDTLT